MDHIILFDHVKLLHHRDKHQFDDNSVLKSEFANLMIITTSSMVLMISGSVPCIVKTAGKETRTRIDAFQARGRVGSELHKLVDYIGRLGRMERDKVFGLKTVTL